MGAGGCCGGAGWCDGAEAATEECCCLGGPRSAFGIVRRSGATGAGAAGAAAAYFTGADPTVACEQNRGESTGISTSILRHCRRSAVMGHAATARKWKRVPHPDRHRTSRVGRARGGSSSWLRAPSRGCRAELLDLSFEESQLGIHGRILKIQRRRTSRCLGSSPEKLRPSTSPRWTRSSRAVHQLPARRTSVLTAGRYYPGILDLIVDLE